MNHTVRRMQNKIINECEAQGHEYRDGLLVEKYHNNKTGEDFEITYDSDTTPVSVKNLTTGQTWERQ